MNNKTRAHIGSFRLRSLPLSVMGIILGMFLALAEGVFRPLPFALAIVTTLCLQILSNIANELGDTIHGTDTPERLGPHYSLQSGGLTIRELRQDVVIFTVLSCVAGLALVWSTFDLLWSRNGLIMIGAGAASVLAALGYTLGRHPYGYMAMGDIMVLIFFGFMSVGGCYFLMTGALPGAVLLPAASCGLFSVGVLNINNIRDMETDRATRITVPLLLGERGAKIYHALLIAAAFVTAGVYCLVVRSPWYTWAFMLLAPLFAGHVRRVFALRGRALDAALPQLAILALVFCLLFGMLQAAGSMFGV